MKLELEKVSDITVGEFPLLLYTLDDVREETFARRLFADLPRVSALRVICTELDLPRDSEQMIQACTEAARALIFQPAVSSKGYIPWLLVAHGFWEPDNRITRYKKLWRRLEQRYGAETFRRGPEIEIASSEGLRYAVGTELMIENFSVGTTVLRANSASALTLTQTREMETEEGLKALFNAAFLKENGLYHMVSWARFIARRCSLGEIVVKAGGSWDERKYYLEFFGLPENLSLLSP